MPPADVLFPGSAPQAALAVCDRRAGSETLIRNSLARQAADSRFDRPGARIHDPGRRHWRRLLRRACDAGAPVIDDAPAAFYPPTGRAAECPPPADRRPLNQTDTRP